MKPQTKPATEIRSQAEFPLMTILACMGIVTLVSAVGLFILITNLRAKATPPVAANVAEKNNMLAAKPEPKKTSNVQEVKGNRDAPPTSETSTTPKPRDVPTTIHEQPESKPETTRADRPAKNDDSIGVAPSDRAKWVSLLGLTATIEGVVQKEGKSGTGKTFYLWFSNTKQDTMVFMLKSKVEDSLTLEFLNTLRGKRVRVTGTVEEQFGTKRLGVKIQRKSQIEIVD